MPYLLKIDECISQLDDLTLSGKNESMKMKLLSVLTVAGMAVACWAAPEAVKASKTAFAAEALKPYVASGALPGAISVLSSGNVQETACVGWADPVKKRPISMTSTFMQCSQTKGFCGVTIAMLVEEGKLSLDEPVSKYLPEFKKYLGL